MKVKKIPMRNCVGCMNSKSKSDLIRVLKTPEGEVTVDGTGRKNGRGAYLCPSVECFNKAKRSKAIARSLNIAIPDDVYEELERQMLEFETK